MQLRLGVTIERKVSLDKPLFDGNVIYHNKVKKLKLNKFPGEVEVCWIFLYACLYVLADYYPIAKKSHVVFLQILCGPASHSLTISLLNVNTG